MSKTASSLLVTAALTFAVAANAGAQQQAAPDTDHVKALIEQAKVRLSIPTDATETQGATQGPKVDLTADEAVARGVFGAPTCFVGEQMYFGQDRLDFVREEALARLPA